MILLAVAIVFSVLIATVIFIKIFGLFDLAKKEGDEFLHRIIEIKYWMSVIATIVITGMIIYFLFME